ncbi:HAMP domain-containing sensor histidine kinase [Streptosporangium sp. NPDC023615]|uniref:sensor histidine kinase n=1 Tax=Streptosporangium sp. NPDC023615 TaxID=3154794 RepID=UPI003413B979
MFEGKAWSVRVRLTVTAVVMALISGAAITAVATAALYGLSGAFKTEEVAGAAMQTARLSWRGPLPAVVPKGKSDGIQVLDAAGRIVATSSNLVGAPPLTDFLPPGSGTTHDRRVCDFPAFPGECVRVVAFRVHREGGDLVVYSAAEPVPWYVHPGLFAVILGASLLTVLMSGLSAYRTVGAALEPVRAIRRELAEITATDIGRRVPVPAARDEIRRLAETINQTLDRLETAAERQRRFTSDASHDLRSPLTAMRAQVEEALHYPDDVDWKAKAHAMLCSLDRLQAIVSDLLTLAKLDSGVPAHYERIDLGTLAGEELDRRKQRVRIDRDLKPGVTVLGDRLRLARLLTNLVDNAERHAASRVSVSVSRGRDDDDGGDGGDGEGTAVLEVLDDGAGIAPDQRELVFQRFTRLDASRNRDAGGTGLGLPIARDIALAHGGTLRLEDSALGARFVLRLPLSSLPGPRSGAAAGTTAGTGPGTGSGGEDGPPGGPPRP